MNDGHASDGLTQLFPAGPASPRTLMTVTIDRGANDAGTQLREFEWSEAVAFQRTLAVALAENITLAHQFAQTRTSVVGCKINERRKFAVARVGHEVGHRRQVRRRDHHCVRAILRQGSRTGRARQNAGEVQYSDA